MSKKTKLIVSGCSYTYGGNDKDTITWGEQLAERLDMELVNLSCNGCGNEFILTTLTKEISKTKKDDIGLVIAMWSEFERIDFPRSSGSFRFDEKKQEDGTIYYKPVSETMDFNYEYKNKKRSWTSVYVNVLYGEEDREKMLSLSSISHRGVREWLDYQNDFIKYCNKHGFWSKLACLDQSFEKFLHFKYMVRQNDLPYLQCVGPNPWCRGEDSEFARKLKKKYYAKNIIDYDFYDELDEPNFVGFPIMQNIGGYSLDDMLPFLEDGTRNHLDGKEDYSYRVSLSDSHPNTRGHKIFADHLYDRYKKIYGK